MNPDETERRHGSAAAAARLRSLERIAHWRVHVLRDGGIGRGSPGCWLVPGTPAIDADDVPTFVGHVLVGRDARAASTSDASAKLSLHDRSVSKTHCRLRLAGGELYVENLSKTNDTYINGRWCHVRAELTGLDATKARVSPRRWDDNASGHHCHDGDVLRVGSSLLVLERCSMSPRRQAADSLLALMRAVAEHPNAAAKGFVAADNLLPGRSETIASVRRAIALRALVDNVPLLLEGESSSGKMYAAKLAHQLRWLMNAWRRVESVSAENKGPVGVDFSAEPGWQSTGRSARLIERVATNVSKRKPPFCRFVAGELKEDMAHARLFGANAGVAPGVKQQIGLVRQALDGVLFIDEINTAGPEVQRLLLDVLRRDPRTALGHMQGTEIEPVPNLARHVCATNEGLSPLVGNGRFRGDLFRRLPRDGHVSVPSVTLRRADVLDLADVVAPVEGGWQHALTADALEVCLLHDWHDNVAGIQAAFGFMAQGSSAHDGTGTHRVHLGDLPTHIREYVEGELFMDPHLLASADDTPADVSRLPEAPKMRMVALRALTSIDAFIAAAAPHRSLAGFARHIGYASGSVGAVERYLKEELCGDEESYRDLKLKLKARWGRRRLPASKSDP